MNLYILLDVTKLESENVASLQSQLPMIAEQISFFISQETSLQGQYIERQLQQPMLSEFALGLSFSVKQKKHLAKPIAFFNQLAEQYKQDFVLGEVINDQGQQNFEPVCYFGYEEGLGDSYLIAEYVFY